MAKAMLIMDMPSCCLHCSCSRLVFDQRCEENGERLTLDNIYEERPTWCPLREVPQKKDTKYNPARNPYITEGYNACIDEILGGGE